MGRRWLSVAFAAILSVLPAMSPAAWAQDASVRVTVRDVTGGVIVGARVAAQQADGVERVAVTNDLGIALLTDLMPGVAEVRVESAGFDPRTVTVRRLRGDARLTVDLQVAALAMTVEVSRDPRDKQMDPRGDAFTRVLTAAEIAVLPDDPDELERVLGLMAGPGATFRVNGFGGTRLPAKNRIRQIRFSLNMFSAEMHELGTPVVDITTQPGLDRWRTSLNGGLRTTGMTARYPYAPVSSSEQLQRAGFTLDGPLVRTRTSVALTIDWSSFSDAQTIMASVPGREISSIATRATDRASVSIEVQQAIGAAHTLRAEFTRNGAGLGNQGVGGSNLPERAYSSTQTDHTVRVRDSGPIGRRLFNDARLQVVWSSSRAQALTARPAIVVLDAFSAGGAQVDNARKSWELEAADDLDFVRGRHAMRAGALVQAARYESMDAANAFGTFTFSNLDEYLAGRPATYTQRLGNPFVTYGFWRAGWFVQDDVKVHRTLTASVGLRQEMQRHINDDLNLAPRVGFTWAPRADGRLVVRGGAGVLYNWFEPSMYEQVLRVDGLRQYDLVLTDPAFPDPFGSDPSVLPRSRFVEDADLRLPRIVSTSVAVQQQFSPLTMLRVAYTHQAGAGLFRGHNLNAPPPGEARASPETGNVIEVQSTGRSRQDRMEVVVSRLGIRNGRARYVATAYYGLSQHRNDTDGPFSVPSGSDDWGPAPSDVRHRLGGVASIGLPGDIHATITAHFSSAPPFNITTGADDNRDTVINDRPPWAGRNGARGAAQVDVSARVGWTLTFGRRAGPEASPPDMRRLAGEAQRDAIGSLNAALGGGGTRYRLEFYGQIHNLPNYVNRTGFRGVLSSPFFGQATASMPPRRIEIGMRFAL